MELDREMCYRALKARDARFDGRFFTAVLSTGIYCRPICPARTPTFEHCLFLPTAAAAQAAGFRSCLRCHPETAPETSAWRGTAATVSRALNLIAEGALDDEDSEQFAARLGMSGRHLRRLFEEHLGASPITVAQTRRILFAKKLLNETRLPIADIALAAGFNSIRRFNTTMQKTYGRSPRELRHDRSISKTRPTLSSSIDSAITLKLPFRRPYNWALLVKFLGDRAIPGIEHVENDRYWRTIEIENAIGTITVEAVLGKDYLLATIQISQVTALAPVVQRLRRMFDVDADVETIGKHLARDKRLKSIVAAYPGLRVPGTWNPFELAIRGILGQQISVAAARTLAGRLVAAFGTPLPGACEGDPLRYIFPRPEVLAKADLTGFGLTQMRASTITAFSKAVMKNPDILALSTTSFDDTLKKLQSIPGIGPWTAHYISMRALHEPDAFPTSDLGLLRALNTTPKRLAEIAEAWRPWRSYAAMFLWQSLSQNLQPTE